MGRCDVGRAITVALLAVSATGLVCHALLYPFISDDAYISFRYADNLARHNELTFNLGERVEGYTNFLWTALLGLLLKLRLRPDVMARVLGAACGVAVLVLTHLLTRLYRGGRVNPWDGVAPLALAASAGFAVWCSGGLETQLFTALMLGGMTLYVAEHVGRVRWRMSGLLLALAAMTRPEGLMVFGLTGLHWLLCKLVSERGWARVVPRRAEIGWLLGFIVPFGLFFLWRYSYYGFPLPNTYYVKAGGGASASAVKWGLPYLWDWAGRDNKLYLLAPLVVGLLVLRPRTAWPDQQDRRVPRPLFVWSYLGLVGSVYGAYVVYVGGDFMAMGRFFVPVMPIVALLLQESLREIVERFPERQGADHYRPLRFGITASILAALLLVNAVGTYRENQKLTYYRWGLDTIAYLKKFADDRILVGKWMRRHLPGDTYLAVGGAGAIVYASRLRALDTFGLNDRWIAHNMPRTGDRPGHTKSAPEHHILQQRPDLMCHQARHQDWPFRPPGGTDPYWRARGYGWVCIAPQGLRPSHYCCLNRLDRDLGPWPPEER